MARPEEDQSGQNPDWNDSGGYIREKRISVLEVLRIWLLIFRPGRQRKWRLLGLVILLLLVVAPAARF